MKTFIKSNKPVLETMLLMIGSVVGVGFVTGVEIEDFFARFDINFIFGIIVLFVLMTGLIFRMLKISNNSKTDYKLQKIDKSYLKNTFLNKFQTRKIFLFFNLLMISSAMFSGLKFILNNLLKHNYILFYLLLVLLVFLILIFGIKGLSKFNYFVIVFLIFVMVFVLKNLLDGEVVEFGEFSFASGTKSIMFAVIYIFMNIVEIEPIVTQSEVRFSNKARLIFSLVFSVILTTFIVMIVLFLRKNRTIAETDMPLLFYFDKQNVFSKGIFCFGLVCSLLSTLAACLLGVKKHIEMRWNDLDNIGASFLAVMVSVIVAILPFSFFTKVIYPIIGILNFLIFVIL